MSKSILITGATGKQGGATLKALIRMQPEDSPFQLLAVTRNPESGGAKALAAKPNVTVVQGDLGDCEALLAKAKQVSPTKEVWAVYSVQAGGDAAVEEVQGKALVDAASKAGVKHFVYTSVDRGGDVKSDTNPTDVPHFICKHNIELHLKKKAPSTDMTYTIFRPTAFMDNLVPGFNGKVFSAMWAGHRPVDKPLQFISAKDIGDFAALAFINADSPEYRNKAIGLAGDDLTYPQAREAFNAAVGYKMPATFSFVGTLLKASVGDLGKMFAWFSKAGYGVDIPKLKAMKPDLMDFKTWVATESAFAKK